jgi:hypothetical protein
MNNLESRKQAEGDDDDIGALADALGELQDEESDQERSLGAVPDGDDEEFAYPDGGHENNGVAYTWQ